MLCSGRLLGDGPDGVDDAGEVAEEGEDKADPELNLQQANNNSYLSIGTALHCSKEGRKRPPN